MSKYIKITNTKNLEARLTRALLDSKAQVAEASDSTAQEADKPVKTANKPAKKSKNTKKFIHRLCLGILGIMLAGLISLSIMGIQQQAEINEISNLQDARLISYENQIYQVKKLALLFAVYDDESYQRAKLNTKLSDELYSSYFVNEHYNKTETPVEIEYQDVLYEITENDYVTYLLYFKRIQGSDIRQYILQAEYVGDTCIYFGVLN